MIVNDPIRLSGLRQAMVLVTLLAVFTVSARARAPIQDKMQVTGIVLLKGDSEDLSQPVPGEPRVVAKEKMPYSADLYLGASGMINKMSPAVARAAQGVKKIAASHQGRSEAVKDPVQLVAATHAWMDQNLKPVDEKTAMERGSTNWTGLWDSAGTIIASGEADDFGRARVGVAILRHSGLPARTCWFRGRPAIQYWVQPELHERQKKVRGYWALDRPRFAGEAVDAWSVIPGDFGWLEWEPAQSMGTVILGFEQAYYTLTDTAQAEEDLEYAKLNGQLPETARARTIPPLPPREGGKTDWLRLVAVRYELIADGSLQGMAPLSILLPYLPHTDWNLEAKPRSPSRLKIEKQGFWTNRPGRVISSKIRDSWNGNNPALGIQHYIRVRLARPRTLIEAVLEGNQLKGRMLRADSLAPQPDGMLMVEFPGSTSGPREFPPDEKGYFLINLTSKELENSWLKVSGGKTKEIQAQWGDLLVPLSNSLRR